MNVKLLFLAPLLSLMCIVAVLIFMTAVVVSWKIVGLLKPSLNKFFSKCPNCNHYSNGNAVNCSYCKQLFLK